MATVRSQGAICRIVKDGILELETEAGHKPYYHGLVLIGDMLLVIDGNDRNLQIYNRHNGKLISTSQELDDIPNDVCLISNTKVAVCLETGTVDILSLKSIDDIKSVKTLFTGFRWHSLAKLSSDKLVISGEKGDMLCWGILSITDGHLDSTHDICKGYQSRVAIKDKTVYISCWTVDSITIGVYAYDIFKPQTQKFLYRHQELKRPWSIMAVKDCVYVCDYNCNTIHQLTDNGQLVTIHTVSSRPDDIFYDDKHGLLYTTIYQSNVITVYKKESLHQPGPSVDDTGRFMHIACLLVNVGSRVLRRLLLYHAVTPTCTLDQYFAKKRIHIDNLRKRKVLNKSQMDILFPPGGSTNLGDYDVTLLSALFTNIVPNVSQQQRNMIQSLRDKRNEIFAHAKSVTVNLNDYQIFWNDICRDLEALSRQCGDPDFENEISREIQGIQVSTVQGTSLLDYLIR